MNLENTKNSTNENGKKLKKPKQTEPQKPNQNQPSERNEGKNQTIQYHMHGNYPSFFQGKKKSTLLWHCILQQLGPCSGILMRNESVL